MKKQTRHYTIEERERVVHLRTNGIDGRKLEWQEIAKIMRMPLTSAFHLFNSPPQRLLKQIEAKKKNAQKEKNSLCGKKTLLG